MACWTANDLGTNEALAIHSVLALAGAMSDLALEVVLGLVCSHIASVCDSTSQSTMRMLAEMSRFASFASYSGIATLDEIDPLLAGDFIDQAVQDRSDRWVAPSTSTRYTRRTAIRTLYGSARQLGLHAPDPTIDMKLPPKVSSGCRPLADDEEALGRVWAKRTSLDTRRPAAWALGQATATNSEMGAAVVGDVDLGTGRVWLHGNENKRDLRFGQLTAWGVVQLAARIEEVGSDPTTPLLTAATASRNATQASTNSLIHETLVVAGLCGEPGIKPASLPAWAGKSVFDATGRIEDVARCLGVRSLDAAAAHIGWSW